MVQIKFVEDLQENTIYKFQGKYKPAHDPFYATITQTPDKEVYTVLVEGIKGGYYFKLRQQDMNIFEIHELGPKKKHPEYYL